MHRAVALLAERRLPVWGSAPQDTLFKADHPRAIDRYIDYFGGVATADDPCGEAFLDTLTPSER